MFYLHKDAKYRGNTPDGFAVWAVDPRVDTSKPVSKPRARRGFKIDYAKVARVRRNRTLVGQLLPRD